MHATRDAATSRDYYAILGLARGATAAEVQRAYLHLARKHHPDLQLAAERPAAAERFAAIAEARRVLSDPELRVRYDALGLEHAAALLAPGRRGSAAAARR